MVSILGPRQCGKTTLAKQYIAATKKNVEFYDLEKPSDFDALEDPFLVLEKKKGLVVIDEIQRIPKIFETLRVIADTNKNVKFLILGSASPHIIKNVSETLAGRVGFIDLSGFSISEMHYEHVSRLWIRGGFPAVYLAKNDDISFLRREELIRTFLERDIQLFGFNISPVKLRRFWTMLAHYHGKQFNASEMAKSLDIDSKTARNYLDLLCGTYMTREILPWVNNTKKRLVKAPKIYFKDTGLLHALLMLKNEKEVTHHPVCGFSWEGFAMGEVISLMNLPAGKVFYWAVHEQAELDMLFFLHGKAIGVEFKYKSSPKFEKSMFQAIKELNLEKLYIVYPGDKMRPLNDKASLVPLKKLSIIKKELEN
ncbi:MAG: ATP-binding protein [Candidatus Omnitrophica bacterium]|nr:ATP-binding protein [Candidatus Omnitrophota bacterium]